MDIADFIWFAAFIISLFCLNSLYILIRSYIASQAPGIIIDVFTFLVEGKL